MGEHFCTWHHAAVSVGFKPWRDLLKIYTEIRSPEGAGETANNALPKLAPLCFKPTLNKASKPPLSAELPLIAEKLQSQGSLEDAELSALRGRVLELTRQQLGQLRAQLNRSMPKAHLMQAELRNVFRGPATVDKVMTIFSGDPDRLGRLSAELRDSIRQARESSVRALLDRRALDLVNGNQGLFKRINPSDAVIHEGEDELDTVTQRYMLLEMVGRLLQVGVPQDEILRLSRQPFRAALDEGNARALKREQKFAKLTRPTGMSDDVAQNIGAQLSLVRWLEDALVEASAEFSIDRNKGYTADLQDLFFSESVEEAEEHLDARFEHIIGTGIKLLLESEGNAQFDSISIERRAADRPKVSVDVRGQQLDAAHPVREQLSLLQARFARGERSAVGVDYALQTFPEDVLQRAAAGELKVVSFDGSQDNGVDYIRNKYGMTEDGLRMGGRVVGLQALYGSYPRSLVLLEDGQQFLLVSGYGASRQLNNAATVMLYEDEQGRRLPVSGIDLATDHTDLLSVFKRNINNAIREDGTGHPEDTPTRLMILQNPKHLEQLLGDELQWGRAPQESLVPFQIAYRSFEDGTKERLIIPKVGGGGLYGDTAGTFMEAFFDTGLENLIPDVIFNGAAGGFAGSNGLPHVSPGGRFMPTLEVEQDGDGLGPQPIPSMLGPEPKAWPKHIQEALEASGVHFTERHIAVMAPAIETFKMIHEIVGRGHASIDVEAGALMAKARELGKTATVLYTHSDDPRASEDDPNASLGRVAPFLEGSRYPPELFSALDALWLHSRSLWQQSR